MNPRPAIILVVDDSAVMRQMICAQLQQAGYASLAASGGDEALAQLARGPVDLVITDWTMLPMNGETLIRQLRGRPGLAALPIVVLSTLSDSTEKARAREAGANGWLSKPLHPDTLTDVLATLIRPDRRAAGG